MEVSSSQAILTSLGFLKSAGIYAKNIYLPNFGTWNQIASNDRGYEKGRGWVDAGRTQESGWSRSGVPARPSSGGSDGQLDCKGEVDHGHEVVSMSMVVGKNWVCISEFCTVFLATTKMRYLISS